jgi:hypothetical protein
MTLTATISGNLMDATGAGIVGGTVTATLANFGTMVPYVTSTGIVAAPAISTTSTTGGAFSFTLYGNDVITPANTYYVLDFVDALGRQYATGSWQFLSGNTYNLNSTPPNVTPGSPGSPVSGTVVPFTGAFTSYVASGTNTPSISAGGSIFLAPFTLPFALKFSNLGWENNSNDGTNLWDFGIYTQSGTLQCHTGPLHLLNSSGNTQTAPVGSTTLLPGGYLYAVTHNSGVAQSSPYFGTINNGILYFSTATTSTGGTLPSSITISSSLTSGTTPIPQIILY